jgi:hypothetical protein
MVVNLTTHGKRVWCLEGGNILNQCLEVDDRRPQDLGNEENLRPIRLAYQPPANSTFLSEQISHQQPASSTFLSEQISTSHQPNEQAVGE